MAFISQCQKIEDKTKFKKCGGCQSQLYCSRECQAKHWKFGGHRQICKEMDEDMRGLLFSPSDKSIVNLFMSQEDLVTTKAPNF